MSDAVILRADERFQTTYLQADCARKRYYRGRHIDIVSMSNAVSSIGVPFIEGTACS